MNLSDEMASLIDQLISLCKHKCTREKKNDNRCAVSKTNNFSVTKHPNILRLKRGKTDVNKSETSCDSKIIYGKIEHAGHVKYRAQS